MSKKSFWQKIKAIWERIKTFCTTNRKYLIGAAAGAVTAGGVAVLAAKRRGKDQGAAGVNIPAQTGEGCGSEQAGLPAAVAERVSRVIADQRSGLDAAAGLTEELNGSNRDAQDAADRVADEERRARESARYVFNCVFGPPEKAGSDQSESGSEDS